MKVAIVCDWLTGIGGAERVVLELHRIFPEAPIYTSQYDRLALPWFAEADVRTGWLQKMPKALKKFLPVLRAYYFSHLKLSGYDLVISSSGAEAKGIRVTGNTVHISYCHSPTHYYWSRYDEYMKQPGFGALDPLARLGLKLLLRPMRNWDYKAAQRPHYLIANSTHIKNDIQKYYGREATVIFPPVDVERFTPKEPTVRKGFVTAGRQTPYKRINLAVQACTKLSLPLTVIGDGPDHDSLVRMAGPTITFLTNVSDEEMPAHFQAAEAFIFPTNVEDFGVTPVEAMAAGTPVIALQAGGPLDYVIPNKTGIFFTEPTVESLVATLQLFSANAFNATAISQAASNFSIPAFQKKVREFIAQAVHNSSGQA